MPYLFLLPACPLNVRVGANSPKRCPTIFSVMYTGMNLFPLCTATVWPTKSGEITDALAQVLTTDFLLVSFIANTFLSNLKSIKGPFFNERIIIIPLYYFFLRSTIYLLEAFFFERVLYPFASKPFRERGCPPDERPSPPPIG